MVIKFIRNLYFILFFIAFFGCKSEKKESFSHQEKQQTLVKKEAKDKTVFEEKLNNNLKDKLIGKTYSDLNEIQYFKGFHSGGSIIGETFNGKNYSISNIRGKGNKTKYILFEEHKENQKRFKILDLLDLSNNKLLISNNLYYHFCYKDGKQDQEIIAIAKYEEEEFLTKILKAWRTDREIEKIIEIPVDGIKVENIDFGL